MVLCKDDGIARLEIERGSRSGKAHTLDDLASTRGCHIGGLARRGCGEELNTRRQASLLGIRPFEVGTA